MDAIGVALCFRLRSGERGARGVLSGLATVCGLMLGACGGSGDSPGGRVATQSAEVVQIKAPDPTLLNLVDGFGMRAVLAEGGRTLVVSAPRDTNNPLTGHLDESTFNTWGSIEILARQPNGEWQLRALIRPPVGPADGWGEELAVSGDGRTVVVGAPLDRGRGAGVGADPNDRAPFDQSSGTAFPQTGAVWVYVKRDDGQWAPQQYIKAFNPDHGDRFGLAVVLSQDGNWMAVGAPGEASGSRGINGNPCGNCSPAAGAVYVFHRDAGGHWSQTEYVKASNTKDHTGFGGALAMSADGNVIAVAAEGEDSADCHINGDQSDRSQHNMGAVYVFGRAPDGQLSQRAYIKACDHVGQNIFGDQIALNAAGDLLAVSAPWEVAEVRSTSNSGVDPPSSQVGRVYVFARTGENWSRIAALGASNAGFGDRFGEALKMSSDGTTIAVGAPGEDGGLGGLDNRQDDDSAVDSGAIYVFRRDAGGDWRQTHYVKTPQAHASAQVGEGQIRGLALSENGDLLAVGDPTGGGVGGSVFLYEDL
jgi:hypothetical protein